MGRRRVEIDLARAEELARAGLTDEAIASAMGFSSKTLQRRKREMSELSTALTRARARAEADVADKLMAMMDDPNMPPKVRFLAATWWLERRAGWTLAAVERAGKEKEAAQALPASIDVKISPFNPHSPEMEELRAQWRREWEQERQELAEKPEVDV